MNKMLAEQSNFVSYPVRPHISCPFQRRGERSVDLRRADEHRRARDELRDRIVQHPLYRHDRPESAGDAEP